MGNFFKSLFNWISTFAIIFAISFQFTNFLHAKSKLAPPDEKGPYSVGFTTFCDIMSAGRVSRIQVFYPTLDPPNCQTMYQVYSRPTAVLPIPNLESCFPNETTNNTYFVSSELCAVQNATVAPGPFPLIVQDHGGGTAGSDYQRLNQAPVHETLASHGFIVVVPLHSVNPVNRVLDLPLVIDTILERNTTQGDALFGRIDPDRIGIAGLSAGGQAALRAIGGSAANGIAGDTRIKAGTFYEPIAPANLEPIVNDLSTISIPYLIMGGDQFEAGELAISELLEITDLATPRIFVLTPNAIHHNYQSGSCRLIDEAREYALENDTSLRDPISNEIILEPLTNFIANPQTGIFSCNPAMGTAGANACALWNQSHPSFPNLGLSFGGGRNLCTRVGVEDSLVSLDINLDGFTDSPPFQASDQATPEVPITGENMVPVIKHYTVAFWKKFLEGDGRYMRYLTPGYANVHDLEAIVDIRE